MKTAAALTALAIAAFAGSTATAAENRCGWLNNPTPGNYWLTDRDASWTILTQGSDIEPEGIENLPDISAGDYVRTNGNYGYACACMGVEVDAGPARILAIRSFRQLSIAQCRDDANLPAPE